MSNFAIYSKIFRYLTLYSFYYDKPVKIFKVKNPEYNELRKYKILYWFKTDK